MRYLMFYPAYAGNSAGIRAMHYLRDLMLSAKLNAIHTNVPTEDPLDVAIYPDSVGPHNPLNAKRIIRFMCAPASWPAPGFYGGGRIPAADMVLIYDGWYKDDVADHYDGVLHRDCLMPIPCIERGLFYPEKKTVQRVTYIGKANEPSFPDYPDMGVVLTRSSHTREECIALLRRTKRVYTLDHYTMLAHEANLCGCKVYKLWLDTRRTEAYPVRGERYIMRPEVDVKIAHRLDAMARCHFGI